MSVKADPQPISESRLVRRIVVAFVVALAIAMVTWALLTAPSGGGRIHHAGGIEAHMVDTLSWDAGKLEAMEGRQLAELFRT